MVMSITNSGNLPLDSSHALRPPRRKSPSLRLVDQLKNSEDPTLPEDGMAFDELLRGIVDACASNVLVLDEEGEMLYASQSWLEFMGAKGLGLSDFATSFYFTQCMRLLDRMPLDKSLPTMANDIEKLRSGNSKEFHGEYCYRGPAQPLHFSVHGARLDLPVGGFRLLVTYKDVMSAVDALRRSENGLSQLLEKTKIVVWESDAKSLRFTYVSEQASRVFGYPISRWYEPDFLAEHIHAEDRERTLSLLKKQLTAEDQFDFTFRLLSENGRVVWVHNLISVLPKGGKSRRLRGFMVDITDRKVAEEALRDLGGRLIAAQEEERSRLARELHDDLNQRMALLSIEMEQFRHDIDKPVNLRRRVKAVQKQAQEISTDIHRLSYQLHPSKLDHLGLGPAVKSLCEEVSRNGKLKIDLRQKGFPADLSRDVTLCAFRIVQEAVRNCTKHSGAQAAQVILEKTETAIRLSVSDNGCGFDPKSSAVKNGLGFISMRERVHLVDGQIQFYSRPQRGTRIEVTIPLNQEVNT